MKILHIIPGEITYIYAFLKMMSWHKDWEDEHIFYAMLHKERAIKYFPRLLVMKELNYIDDNEKKIDKNLKNMIKESDKIIWHSFIRIPDSYKKFLSRHPSLIKKSYWCMCSQEIEYLQKKRLDSIKVVSYWMEYFLDKITIISPSCLYDGLINKYATNVLGGEYPYPYCYNRQMESVLINKLEKYPSYRNISQIGFSASIINEHNILLKVLEAKNQFKKKYTIPLKYADYVIGNQIDVEIPKKIADYLYARDCEVIFLNRTVPSYNYLSYLNSLEEIYIGEVPAMAINSLLCLGYLNKDIYNCGKNMELINFNFNAWAVKEFDIEYIINQWRILYKNMGV